MFGFSLSPFALVVAASAIALSQSYAVAQPPGGGLSIKELPEHMQPHFSASDGDKDGQLKGDEIKSLASHFSRARMEPGNESSVTSGSLGAPAMDVPDAQQAAHQRRFIRIDADGSSNDNAGLCRQSSGGLKEFTKFLDVDR